MYLGVFSKTLQQNVTAWTEEQNHWGPKGLPSKVEDKNDAASFDKQGVIHYESVPEGRTAHT
jgi:hypothetical protein